MKANQTKCWRKSQLDDEWYKSHFELAGKLLRLETASPDELFELWAQLELQRLEPRNRFEYHESNYNSIELVHAGGVFQDGALED